jgi:hypothetical protein
LRYGARGLADITSGGLVGFVVVVIDKMMDRNRSVDYHVIVQPVDVKPTQQQTCNNATSMLQQQHQQQQHLPHQQKQPFRHLSRGIWLRHKQFRTILQRMIGLFVVAYGSSITLVQAGWIDPDTPEQYHTTKPLTTDDHREFQLVRRTTDRVRANMNRLSLIHSLKNMICQSIGSFWNALEIKVFSDEFEQDGRTFIDGEDPRWNAIHKNDCKSYLEYLISSLFSSMGS